MAGAAPSPETSLRVRPAGARAQPCPLPAVRVVAAGEALGQVRPAPGASSSQVVKAALEEERRVRTTTVRREAVLPRAPPPLPARRVASTFVVQGRRQRRPGSVPFAGRPPTARVRVALVPVAVLGRPAEPLGIAPRRVEARAHGMCGVLGRPQGRPSRLVGAKEARRIGRPVVHWAWGQRQHLRARCPVDGPSRRA